MGEALQPLCAKCGTPAMAWQLGIWLCGSCVDLQIPLFNSLLDDASWAVLVKALYEQTTMTRQQITRLVDHGGIPRGQA